MFTIPGIAALIVFILARPQEFIPLLQRVPFLHLFTALAVIGLIIDLRLRRLQPIAAPTMPWAVAFFGWAILTNAAVAPDQLIGHTIEMAILFALYGTIAHGIQRFRTFQVVIGVFCTTIVFISGVCFHQGLSPMQCIGGEETEGEVTGTPDGRECDNGEQCKVGGEPGLDYRCEHVGAFGTFSVQERVRYRGELQDPNEVALTISAGGLAILIAFVLRKRGFGTRILLWTCVALVGATIWLTQSRGGLIAGLLVPGVYVVRKWGLKAVIPAGLIALPVLMLGGRSGEAADLSTEMRYEAWSSGLQMFHQNPLFGVGARNFDHHHWLTAHNSYVLTLAEMGIFGMFLFITLIYLSIKSLVVGLRTLGPIEGTGAAQVWGMALLAAMAGIVFQINTLSFAYHPVLWLFFAFIGAWCSAVRHHKPDFIVKMTGRDIAIVAGIALSYAFVVLPVFLRLKNID
jgi:hypothetical protein